MPHKLPFNDIRFGLIFEKTPFATALLKYPEAQVVDVNPAFENLFALKREEILGKSTADLGIHNDFTEREKILEEFARTGKMRNVERSFTSRNGKKVIVLNNVDRIEVDGKVYILSTMEDITERKETLQKLKEKEEQLSEALKIRDEFLSIASHELKTPLTSLKLQTEFRKRIHDQGKLKILDDAKVSQLIEGDLRQINRITRLIDHMLDISRINTGKLSVHATSFDLSRAVHDVIERCRPQFDANNITVLFQSEGSVVGNWDQFRIEQVITNLLINALKYGQGKPVEVVVTTENKNAVVKVKDYGSGISKENQSRIFERFERAVEGRQISGLGLGLFIAKQIIEIHQGKISIESELGKGSTFKVELPLN